MKIEVFYDKECPFCNLYSKYIVIKENNELILCNAREYINELEKFKINGFNIDDGFIVRTNDKEVYQGVDAIVFLNTLSKRKVHLTNNNFFRNVVYPFVKFLRKVFLFILGKSIYLLKKENT